MPSPSHHVELAVYADVTAIIATSRKPTLLVNYLESYLNDLQRWLSEWRISINVNKSRRYFSRVPPGFLTSPDL
jgi:predicted Zn-dependent protease